MKQVIIITALFGLARCGIYTNPFKQYYQQPLQYGNSYGQYNGLRGSYYPHAAKQIPILRLEEDKNTDGTYKYAYETGNGITVQERGDGRGGTVAHGRFSYTSPDGSPVQLLYTADEKGFQPHGSHVPAIPETIRRSIEKNLADEARGIVDDGQYRAGPSERYGVSQGYDSHRGYNRYIVPQKSYFQKYNSPYKQYGYTSFPVGGGYKF